MVDKPDNAPQTGDEENDGDDKPKYKLRRFGRRMGDQQGSTSSMWLISFTDVMALMLTFFVLLFAMSNPDQEKFEQFKENVQQNFNKFEGELLNRGSEDSINIARIDYNEALDLKYLQVLISNLIEQNSDLSDVTIMQNAGRLILSFPEEMLFETGGATLKTQATKTLYSVVNALRRIRNSVEVIGHTDPRPIRSSSSSAFKSNWELSLARAANVAGLLESIGYDKPIMVKGYASGRYDDLPPEFTQDARMSLSRRVDIVIRQDDGKRAKLFDIGLP